MTDAASPWFTNWLEAVEPHAYLKRFKASWAKRFRPTRMEELYESVDLANFLVALDRDDEAQRLLAHVTGLVTFDDNYNTWSPAGAGRVLLARLHRLRGAFDERDRVLAPVVENPFQATPRDELYAEAVASHARELADAARETRKWACHGLSRHLMRLHLLQETALAGLADALAAGYDCGPLEAMVVESYAQLRERLG